MEPEAILIDLDGVLYTGDTPVPGAREAIGYLEEHGYPYRVVSNTTRSSRPTIASRLASLGFAIPASFIFTPAMAAAAAMTAAGRTRAALLATRDVAGELVAAGIQECDTGVQYVVVGDAGDLLTYASLNAAFRHLLRGADLIALEKDRSWMGADGMMLSAGPFVTALEYASGKTARVMGKPSPDFFALALASLGVQPGQAVMIGDDVVTDVGGAISCGLSGILVRTGKYGEDALRSARVAPTAILSSIADLPEYLESGVPGT